MEVLLGMIVLCFGSKDHPYIHQGFLVYPWNRYEDEFLLEWLNCSKDFQVDVPLVKGY